MRGFAQDGKRRAAAVQEALGLLLCRLLRRVERFVPPWCLRALLWPMAVGRAWWELAGEKSSGELFHRLPPSLRPALPRSAWMRRLRQQRTAVNLSKLLSLWPDRLGEPRWQPYCRCIGGEQVAEWQARGRPIVAATLHFGPSLLLRCWLRTRGVPAAAVRWGSFATRPRYRRYLDRICDEVGGTTDIPHVFGLDELRQASRFLQPGRLLFIAVEGDGSRHVLVRGEDFAFPMATGALRLAARADAEVVPCLIRADRPWGFTIHFGRPVPPAWVRDKNRHAAACDHLLREFLPVIADQLEQCGPELLRCFQPAVGRVHRSRNIEIPPGVVR